MSRILQILQSRTVIASIVTVIAGALSLIFKLDADAAAAVQGTIAEVLTSAVAVVSGISAIYFRINTKADLTKPS